MATSFSITTPSNSVLLNSNLQGHAVFTVTNISGRINRGRARVVPKNTAAAAWLKLEDAAERDFVIASTQQFSVAITVPPNSPAGSYLFDLQMIGVENPDEDLAQSPTVTFEVPASAPKPKFPWWILIAAAVVLLVIVGILIAVLRPQPLAVPDVSGITQAAAERQLEAAGLRVQGVTFQASAAVPNTLVIGSDPAAGAQVEPGSAVSLIISTGPQPTPTPIPTLTPTAAPTATLGLSITLSPVTLIAHYPLQTNANDVTNQTGPMTLVNAPFTAGGVSCNGVYEGSGAPNFCKITTPQLTEFNFNAFSISARFKPADTREMPVFVGGRNFRWIGFLLLENGHVGLLHNNSSKIDCGQSYTPGTTYQATITYNGTTARLYLNNTLACSQNIALNHDNDANISTTNYSNGRTFFGTIGDLRVYRSVITP